MEKFLGIWFCLSSAIESIVARVYRTSVPDPDVTKIKRMCNKCEMN